MADVASISDMYDWVMPDLPGAVHSVALVDRELKTALRTFCRESEAWEEQLDPISLIDGVQSYTMYWDYCANITKIHEVRINSSAGVTAGTEGTKQDPSLYKLVKPDVVRLEESIKPAADITNALDVVAILIPKMSEFSVPCWFLNDWAEAIAGHAKWKLAIMQNASWSSASVAADGRFAYFQGVDKAKGDAANGNRHTEEQHVLGA